MQQAATAGVKVSAKPANYYEHVEVAHVCLQESRLKDCRYVGCPAASNECVDDGRESDLKDSMSPGCVNQISGTTQLAGCCSNHDDYSSTDSFNFGSVASVGSCDFSVDLYRDPTDPCDYGPIEQAPNVWKIGGASGT